MKSLFRFILTLTVCFGIIVSSALAASISPNTVEWTLQPGQSDSITKDVTTDVIPPAVDICLLEDETGSFWDDIAYLQGGTTAEDIFDDVRLVSADSQFAVAGFRDYDVSPYGSPGDWVYRLLSGMSADKAAWLGGIAALSASGGADTPEAQYDAIVAAVIGGFGYGSCGWRDVPGVARVLIVTTDAPFHLPGEGKPHVNTEASTVTALTAAGVTVIGLKAPGAGLELDALAAATGGSVQALSSDGANIASAITAGLSNLTTDVWATSDCGPDLTVSWVPEYHDDIVGGSVVSFAETIAVPNTTDPGDEICTVTFWVGDRTAPPGTSIGTQAVTIHVVPVPVDIDIKPGSFPNSINPTKKGVIPVAILGSADFDVTMVNVATLMFVPGALLPAHDLMDPLVYTDHLQDVNLDGYMDLVSHYDQMLTGLVPADIEACLVGDLMDGRSFEGCDSVRVLEK